MRISSAYIEITNRCNLNCAECYNRSGMNKKTVEISPLYLKNIINTLFNDYGVDLFYISGGEPVLHSQWDEMLDVMKSFEKCTYLIITNGTIKSPKLYNMLETNESFMAQFSLDGVDEETHSKHRGKGNFNKTLSNIKSLNSINPPVIKMVISRFNINQLEDYFKLAKELKCIPDFDFSEKMGNAYERWDDFYLTEQEKLNAVEKIKNLVEKYKIDAKIPYATFACPLADEDKPLDICIKSDGSIHPCQNLYDSDFSLGYVYKFDKGDIEGRLDNLRKKILERIKNDDYCSKCMIKEICNKGCPAHAYNLNRVISGNDGSCQFRKMQIIKFSLMDKLKNKKE